LRLLPGKVRLFIAALPNVLARPLALWGAGSDG